MSHESPLSLSTFSLQGNRPWETPAASNLFPSLSNHFTPLLPFLAIYAARRAQAAATARRINVVVQQSSQRKLLAPPPTASQSRAAITNASSTSSTTSHASFPSRASSVSASSIASSPPVPVIGDYNLDALRDSNSQSTAPTRDVSSIEQRNVDMTDSPLPWPPLHRQCPILPTPPSHPPGLLDPRARARHLPGHSGEIETAQSLALRYGIFGNAATSACSTSNTPIPELYLAHLNIVPPAITCHVELSQSTSDPTTHDVAKDASTLPWPPLLHHNNVPTPPTRRTPSHPQGLPPSRERARPNASLETAESLALRYRIIHRSAASSTSFSFARGPLARYVDFAASTINPRTHNSPLPWPPRRHHARPSHPPGLPYPSKRALPTIHERPRCPTDEVQTAESLALRYGILPSSTGNAPLLSASGIAHILKPTHRQEARTEATEVNALVHWITTMIVRTCYGPSLFTDISQVVRDYVTWNRQQPDVLVQSLYFTLSYLQNVHGADLRPVVGSDVTHPCLRSYLQRIRCILMWSAFYAYTHSCRIGTIGVQEKQALLDLPPSLILPLESGFIRIFGELEPDSWCDIANLFCLGTEDPNVTGFLYRVWHDFAGKACLLEKAYVQRAYDRWVVVSAGVECPRPQVPGLTGLSHLGSIQVFRSNERF
ncbi:hypothetical protein CPB85DRAFT_1316843 [Mucidula mucida]|nr:hypothetical protein CPB85DRAFT_1316843 [Mucidula mucida]